MVRTTTMTRHGFKLAALSVVAAATFGACSGDSAPEHNVQLKNVTFQPGSIEVSVGDAVSWANEDTVMHTVTSGIPQEQGVPGVSENKDAKPDGIFDHEMPPEETFEFTFEDVGTFQYFCNIHPGMTATVTVN
jgi:plastocyanin